MLTEPAPWLARAERIRLATAPLVTFLSTALALCCVVALPDAASRGAALRGVDERVIALTALAVGIAVGVAVLALLLASAVGAGPSIAAGATFALIGLALARDIDASAALVIGLLTLSIGFGGLVAGGLAAIDRMPPRTRGAAFVGWLLPLVGGWGAVGWLTLQRPESGAVRVGGHPPVVVLALVGGVLVVWAMLTTALEPVGRTGPSYCLSDSTWAALMFVVAGGVAVVMLIGFQPGADPSWLRPVTLLSAAVILAGLLGAGWALRQPTARVGYLVVLIGAVTGPSAVQVAMMVSSRADHGLSAWVLVVLLVAGAGGGLIGLRGGLPWAVTGLIGVALTCAAGWVLPGNVWLMLAFVAPMGLSVAMALAGGWAAAAQDRGMLTFVSVAGIAGFLLGFLACPSLTWALGAGLSGSTADARAGGRVWLGLTFALAVLGATVATVLLDEPASRADDG